MSEQLHDQSVTISDAIHVAAPETTTSHDLRSLFQAVGRFSGQRGPTTTPEIRPLTDKPVEILEEDIIRVSSAPLRVAGFLDGVQASLVVTYRSHRPVYLNFTGAAAVTVDLQPLGLLERLDLVTSTVDAQWANDLGSSVPLTLLSAELPADVERLGVASLAGQREELERALIGDLIKTQTGTLVLDGSLVGRPIGDNLVGVVKTTQRRYLTDESCLFGLPVGWRSPKFRIPSGSQGVDADRYSCYLRLADASDQAWSYGLIRLESFNPDQLDPLAALCLQQRQSSRSGDRRHDRHLRAVRACEDLLRARRPAVYNL